MSTTMTPLLPLAAFTPTPTLKDAFAAVEAFLDDAYESASSVQASDDPTKAAMMTLHLISEAEKMLFRIACHVARIEPEENDDEANEDREEQGA